MKYLYWTLGIAAVCAAGFYGYMELVKAGVLRYNKWDRRERGTLQVGAQVPDVPLTMYDGTPTSLSKLWQTKPVFLVFGELYLTALPKKIGDLHALYDKYKDRAEFLTVYISEAHPDDEWQMDSNRKDKVVFNQPKTFEDRKILAKVLVDVLHCRIPVAIDAMDNGAEKQFAAWPERLYLLAPGGRVVYKGGMGPFDFDIDEGEKALAAYFTARP